MKNPAIKKATQDDFVKTSLRLPQDLHESLSALAEYNGHSLNAEILAHLRAAPLLELVQTLVKDNADMKLMLRELLDQVDRS